MIVTAPPAEDEEEEEEEEAADEVAEDGEMGGGARRRRKKKPKLFGEQVAVVDLENVEWWTLVEKEKEGTPWLIKLRLTLQFPQARISTLSCRRMAVRLKSTPAMTRTRKRTKTRRKPISMASANRSSSSKVRFTITDGTADRAEPCQMTT